MLAKIDYVQTVTLQRYKKITIKFAENLELTFDSTHCDFFDKYYIPDVKGDFEITKISVNFSDGTKWDNTYDKEKNVFTSYSTCRSATFYITANMKEINFDLQIPSTRFLKVNRFKKNEFILPCNDDLKFTYYVKKIKANAKDGKDIEILIENPYDIQIQGKKGDFKIEKCSTETKLTLLFGFSAEESDKSTIDVDENSVLSVGESEEFETASNKTSESTQAVAIVESCPQSVVPTESSSHATTVLQKLHSNVRYSDVVFTSSDGNKIRSHRCILAEFSDIFVKIFDETSELPVEITVVDFDADTIQSALNFLYGRNDAINSNEAEVFKFAVKFGIQILIDFCCSFFEESVSPLNVCEFIQIAYLHNFDALKQKCLKFLVEKKKEIDPSEIAELPKNILFDAFCF